MNVDKRIGEMRERLERSKPARMVVTLANGESITTDPIGAITLFQERKGKGIAGVSTNRADYMGLAVALDVLCRPAPDRRIEDYE